MFGPPQKQLALSTSFTVAVFASMIESVGDYFATQKVCEVEPPPSEAISRGILIEGLASMLSGTMGVGHATTSYSTNIGMLRLTQVMLVMGMMLMMMIMLIIIRPNYLISKYVIYPVITIFVQQHGIHQIILYYAIDFENTSRQFVLFRNWIW